MGTPYLGEVKMVSFNFAPRNWAFCNGQLLLITSNQALFALLGTYYGGDGVRTFALPNLQGCVPVHNGVAPTGTPYVIGETGGAVAVTLASNQAGHSHPVNATATATSNTAAGNFPAAAGSDIYGSGSDTTMNSGIISHTGGSQSHNNLQPFLVVNFVIALSGVFPPQG
jgi:microcystin-dependent protein